MCHTVFPYMSHIRYFCKGYLVVLKPSCSCMYEYLHFVWFQVNTALRGFNVLGTFLHLYRNFSSVVCERMGPEF